MNLNKVEDFFKAPKTMVNIIGCGSVGSTVAENLARCGVSRFTLWDFDIVEEKNIVNQMFTQEDVGKNKAQALARIITSINPEAADCIKIKEKGWEGQTLSGYVFLCVDSIEIRRKIVEEGMNNNAIKAMFDFRTGLEGAQHYAADWSDKQMKTDLLKTMQFSHEEAVAETPTSACGITLGVATTVRVISAYGVNNFINFIKRGELKKMIMGECFEFILDAF